MNAGVLPGTTIRIIGSGFAIGPSDTTITIGVQKMPALALSPQEVVTVVPFGNGLSPVIANLTVSVGGITSAIFPMTILPPATSSDPPGTLVTRLINLETTLNQEILSMKCSVIASARFVPDGRNAFVSACGQLISNASQVLTALSALSAQLATATSSQLALIDSLLVPQKTNLDRLAQFVIPGFTDDGEGIPTLFDNPCYDDGSLTASQIADGGGWQTTFTLTNRTPNPAPYTLSFWGDGGGALALPIAGAGRAPVVQGTIAAGGVVTIQTAGTDAAVSQGWADLQASGAVGGLAVFTQRVPGRPDFEASVPLNDTLDNRFVLPFDNTGNFVTAMAIANTRPDATAVVFVTFRDANGLQIGLDTIILPPHTHTAFALPVRFAPISGRGGVVAFSTSSFSVVGLGLRFNPGGAFTSFPLLSP